MVLAGEKDLSATPEIMQKMYDILVKERKNSRFVVSKNATHMCAMEDAEATADVLLALRTQVDIESRKR